MIAWILPGRDLCDTRASVVATDEGSTQAPLGNVQSNEDLNKNFGRTKQLTSPPQKQKSRKFLPEDGNRIHGNGTFRYTSQYQPWGGGQTNKDSLWILTSAQGASRQIGNDQTASSLDSTEEVNIQKE